MPRIRLVHWNEQEAAPAIDLLRSWGYHVDHEARIEAGTLARWRKSRPDAFVIDLSRLPSHGREIAVDMRQSPTTRHIPIVFTEGSEEKVEAIRQQLPDASYTAYAHLASVLTKALAKPPSSPVVPPKMMERYAGRTVAQKLGIVEASRLALIDPPQNYATVLGTLPKNVDVVEDGERHVTLCFVHDPAAVQSTLSSLRHSAKKAKLWILWRKKTSPNHSGITEDLIRNHALDLGLVDYKVCAVNKDWSALLLALRKSGA